MWSSNVLSYLKVWFFIQFCYMIIFILIALFLFSSVDNNVDFDSIHQRDIDEQEKYFDEESSHSSN